MAQGMTTSGDLWKVAVAAGLLALLAYLVGDVGFTLWFCAVGLWSGLAAAALSGEGGDG